MTSLLSPNKTNLETSLEQSMIPSVSVDFPRFCNPDTCHPEHLPFLAWAHGVENWSDAWSEQTKRAAIKQSMTLYRRKGTVSAIRHALSIHGVTASVREWFKTGGAVHTFLIDVFLSNDADQDNTLITPELRADIESAIKSSKRASQHFTLATGHSMPMQMQLTGFIRAASQHFIDGATL